MHATKKVVYSPDETPEYSPEARMDVHSNTADTAFRTVPSTDPGANVHRSTSEHQTPSHDAHSHAEFESELPTADNEESPDLDALQPQQLGNLFKAYDRRYANYAETKSSNSSQRMAVYNRLSNLELNLNRLQKTIDMFMEKANRNTSDTLLKKPRSRLKKIQTTMQLDNDAVVGQIQAMIAQMATLMEHDRRLEHAENAFDNVTQAISTVFRNLLDSTENTFSGPEVALAPSPVFQSVRSDASAAPLSPELEQFYKALSDMRIMQERFAYLEAERNEQWERRILLEDQGQLPDRTHDEFLEDWENRLNEAELNFENAKKAMEETRRACEAANIAIPDLDGASSVGSDNKQEHLRAPLGEPYSPPIIQPSLRLFEEVISQPPLQDRGTPSSTSPVSNNQLTNERIWQWRDNIAPSVTPVLSDPLEEPPAPTSANFPSISHFACRYGDETAARRSRSCPTLPHPTSTPPIPLSRSRSTRSVGTDDDLEIDLDVWGRLMLGFAAPP